MAIISGKAYWTSISTPNDTFEPVWSLDVSFDEASKATIQGLGLSIKNKADERGDFVTIKRKVFRKDGSKNEQPALKDAHKNPMGNTLVGNGSDVKVLFKPFDWEYAGKAGVGADLQAVQVVNLIPFGNDEDFDVIPNGYSSSGDSFMDEEINFSSSATG
jgi:hypothetical protein